MPPRQTPPPPPNPRRRQGPAAPGGWVWLVLLAMILMMVWYTRDQFSGIQAIDYSDFQKLAEAGKLKKVTFVGPDKIIGEVKDANDLTPDLKDPEEFRKRLHDGKFSTLRPDKNDPQKLMDLLNQTKTPYSQESESGAWMGPLAIILFPTLILLGVLFLFVLPRLRDPFGGSFTSNYIKSPARRYERGKARMTFDDVAGVESAKSELQEIVDFLRSPEKFQRLGAQVPKGVLLVGPPGTGKTLLVRAVAGEAGVPFYSVSGSEFIQMFVGVGASRVRDMFKNAKENAPCLIFIDEIDAVGRMRGAGVGGGSDEREQTLNQILSEMDGFQPNDLVIVLAATNRPDVLDSALLRPGRFDRHITIDRPTLQGRLAILKIHTRNKPLGPDVNLELIAREMIGMTGADLRNLANEAALLATRHDRPKITQIDFEHAADRILIGPKREEVLTQEDRRKTAYHEAGHACVTWLEPSAERPHKVSIIPRGQSLGVNVAIPEEERVHNGMEYFKAKLVFMMGGRAADRLMYGQAYAGASSDIKQATRLARFMVSHWGMSDRLGPMAFRVGEEHVFLGKEIQEARDFSEGMAQVIDEEVQRLLREADEVAYQHLSAHREVLTHLAEQLLEREEMSREEIDQLMREHDIIFNGKAGEIAVLAPGSVK
jgi:cell division protease FtsH